MSNSSLVTYKKLSPNCTKPRRNKITGIVIHHMAGKLTVKECGGVFASKSRQASSNYGVDGNGGVGLYVDEANRAWTTSNAIDHSCVTIEVANDVIGGQWHVSDKALAKTIDLCADICKRNGIKKLNYTGDKKGNLYMHKWFYSTSCPGPYLASKFSYIADEVNKKLNASTSTAKKTTSSTTTKKTTTTANKSKAAAAASYNKSKSGTYKVTAGDGLNLRTGAGTSYKSICLMPKGATVSCYGYYTKKWLFVSYKGETGFCHTDYLKKV